MRLMVTVELIKKQAKRMQLVFACRGVDLKLAHCYEALSVMHGHKDWNTFCAYLKNNKSDHEADDHIDDSVGNK